MTESVRVSGVVGADLERVFDAFLDSAAHSAMTGGPASISAVVGTPFTAWDGYIKGSNLFVDRPRRIVQSWRASDFPDGANDSMLEIQLDAVEGGTEITFVHTGIPVGMSRGFLEGWHKFYLDPMKTFFGAAPKEPAAKKRSPKKAAAKKSAPKKTTKTTKKSTPKKSTPKKTTKTTKKAAAKTTKKAAAKTTKTTKKAAAKTKKAAPKSKTTAKKKPTKRA